MPLDADIVSCAAPWPGAAARLLEGLATLGPGTWQLDHICASANAGIDPGTASQVLAGLSTAGLGYLAEDDTWTSACSAAELLRLAQVLKGADHYRRLRKDASAIELAVTMPMAPSHLERELATIGSRRGGFLDTPSAFMRIAQSAQRRLVLMAPFIDRAGFLLAQRLFIAAAPAAERILIIRELARYAALISSQHQPWLAALNVQLVDYNLVHDQQSARSLEFETFHAKIVLADDAFAYVGSANLLWSSEAASLEAGVLITGPAAADVARLVDAVLRATRAVTN
jgi:hypothetical protein